MTRLLQQETSLYIKRRGILLKDLLICLNVTNTEQSLQVWRSAWRDYALHLLEYAYVGCQQLEQEDTRPWWKRWLPRRKIDYRYEKQRILGGYWYLQIVKLREAGKLPAWEGIRIIREKK